MLSIAPVSTAQAMGSYYESEDYYTGDTGAAAVGGGRGGSGSGDTGTGTNGTSANNTSVTDTSVWFGKGAARAGLAGPVDPQDFRRILDGQTPDGKTLGRMVKGERQHRAGLDLTFSAPKSVSVIALVAGDERLMEAHEDAVKAVLEHIEQEKLMVRVWNRETGQQEKQGNQEMVAATFRHHVNRNQDPQLHTHSVIANMALGSDGKWRSLSNESLYTSKMALGAWYRAELAWRCRQLGYAIEVTHRDGRFELAEVPDAVLKAFSTRRQEIEAALETYSKKDARTAETATLMTRNRKTAVPYAELVRGWQAQAQNLGFDGREHIPDPVSETTLNPTTDHPVASHSVASHPVANGRAEEGRPEPAPEKPVSGNPVPGNRESQGDTTQVQPVAKSNQGQQGRGESANRGEDRPERRLRPDSPGLNGKLLSGKPPRDRPETDRPKAAPSSVSTEPVKTASGAPAVQDPKDQPSSLAGPAVHKSETGPAASEIVRHSIDHLSERASVFRQADLKTHALTQAAGRVTPREITAEIHRLEIQGQLMPSHHKDHAQDPHVTTLKAVKTERETIEAMRASQGTIRPLVNTSDIHPALDRNASSLNEGQKAAVIALLTGTDRIIGVQGYAGVGKTTLLKAAREIAEKHDYDVHGLAPSASATKTLGSETGMDAMTLQRFLGIYARYTEGTFTDADKGQLRQQYQNTVLILDEASFAGTRQMRDLLRIADVLRPARLVLVGDEKQLEAVEAGKPFAQLQEHGLTTVQVDAILRQKNPALRQAVEATIQGDMAAAFEKIGPNIYEATPVTETGDKPTRQEREQALVEKALEVWQGLPRATRDHTGIAVPTNALREKLNAALQQSLKEEGRLKGPPLPLTTFRSAQLTTAEKRQASSYQPGETVIFNRDIAAHGLKQGDRATVADRVTNRAVTGQNDRNRTVTLQKENGETFVWSLEKTGNALDVLKSQSIALHQGDMVVFTRNSKKHGLVNSETAKVTGITEEAVTFHREDGQRLTLKKDDPALTFIDLAYASTLHAFQGKTVDTLMGVMESGHPHLTTRKAFYVALSRARDKALLVTDDKERLARTVQEQTGGRIAALEATVKPAPTPSPEHPALPRTDLSVPYAEREAAKALGARWDAKDKTWYVPGGTDPAPFARWKSRQVRGLDPRVDPARAFAVALQNHGLVLRGDPVMDGKWHRVKGRGPGPADVRLL